MIIIGSIIIARLRSRVVKDEVIHPDGRKTGNDAMSRCSKNRGVVVAIVVMLVDNTEVVTNNETVIASVNVNVRRKETVIKTADVTATINHRAIEKHHVIEVVIATTVMIKTNIAVAATEKKITTITANLATNDVEQSSFTLQFLSQKLYFKSASKFE